MNMNAARLFLAQLLFAAMPPTRLFAVKARLLRWAGANIGSNVRIVSSARFHVSGPLTIGNGTWIGEDVRVLGGTAPVTIGANVDIGPRVTIVTGSHVLWETAVRAAGTGTSSAVVVGDGVWIGACATVLGGAHIGRCSMVAACALVNRSVDEYTLVAGIPARFVRHHGPAIG